MAWNLTLQNASFRGVPFEVEAVEDRGDNALVLHEYPWRSGAEVENMGRKARVVLVTPRVMRVGSAAWREGV